MSAATLAPVLLALAVGGALGATLRHLLDRRLPGAGVLLANTLAALILGGWLGAGVDAGLPLGGAVTGLCLALGTWSTVAVRAAEALLAGRAADVARVWAAHLGATVVAVLVGWGLGDALAGHALWGPAGG